MNYFLLFVTFPLLSGRGSHREVINQLLPTPPGEAGKETHPACVPTIPGAKRPGTPCHTVQAQLLSPKSSFYVGREDTSY